MIAQRPTRLLSFITLIFLLQPVFTLSASGQIPAGAEILFRDDFSAGHWKGAEVKNGSSYGISGKVLIPSGYGDTVRIEKQLNFTLEPESFLCFDLHCSGYQRLRIYAREGEDSPKSVLLTRFKAGEPEKISLPLDGNFHNFHWRQGNYSALQAGDSIVRLVFEFTLPEDSPGCIQVGEIAAYSLTEDSHRKRAEKILAEAKKEVAEIPDYLEPKRSSLNECREQENGLLLPAGRG